MGKKERIFKTGIFKKNVYILAIFAFFKRKLLILS